MMNTRCSQLSQFSYNDHFVKGAMARAQGAVELPGHEEGLGDLPVRLEAEHCEEAARQAQTGHTLTPLHLPLLSLEWLVGHLNLLKCAGQRREGEA